MLKIERIALPEEPGKVGYEVGGQGHKSELVFELGVLMGNIRREYYANMPLSVFAGLVASAAELEPDEVADTMYDILKGAEDGK